MSLSLAEQVALFGLHDTCGSTVSTYLKYALSGAILADLLLHHRIELRGKQIQVIDATPVGDDILDEALCSVRSAPDRPLKRWVRGVLAEYQKERVFDRLVQAGIVERVECRTLGLIPYKRYPARDMHVEEQLRRELRDLVAGVREGSESHKLLLSILRASGLTSTFLTQEELDACKSRMEELVAGEPIGLCVQKAVEDDEAAAATAVIVCSVSS
jgi:hypothetical protein